MAPFPQTSATSSAIPEPHAPSVLPGLKRGIAVGVASSVCLILIALLAFFVLRRRKQRKAQQQQGHSPHIKELPAWSDEKSASPLPEKNWLPIPPSPIEADTRTIYELDASPVPELPSRIHLPGAQELDAENASNNLDDKQLKSLAIKESVERHEGSEPRSREVPTLRISPPELSPLRSSSLLGMSPLSVSPLEEAYLTQSPRSTRSPQHWT